MIEMSLVGPKDWGKLIPVAAIELAVANSTKMAALGIQADFYVTVATWEHKPTFNIITHGKYAIAVETADENYRRICEGTSAHDIYPRGKRLRFRLGYSPKTKPNGRIASYAGRRAGGKVIYARKVRHPGFSGRHFDKLIRAKWEKQYPTQLRRALSAAIRGH